MDESVVLSICLSNTYVLFMDRRTAEWFGLFKLYMFCVYKGILNDLSTEVV